MGTAAPTEPRATHHDLAVHEVLLLLETDRARGLTEAEATRRLRQFGHNELPRVASVGPLTRLLRQMRNPLVYVLLAAGVVTVSLGEWVDASVILGVVVVNAIVGFVQESKAESALDALRSMVHTDARVVREGQQRPIHSEELVPGDVALVGVGDKVPADLRVITQADLHVDESALTGESLPVAKDEVVLPEPTPVADRRNMAYSGTFVTSGTGSGIVVYTGGDTELGEIHRLVGSAEKLATPLTRKLSKFSVILTFVILGLAGGTFVIGVARGEPAAAMFTAAVALAVGAIPEGLPAAVTITLAIGVARMARRRAVIRRLPAVETLGGATVICTDKTGTLTENQMTVKSVWTPDQEVLVPDDVSVTSDDARRLTESVRWSLLAGANCNDSKLTAAGPLGDPTETAMLRVSTRYGIQPHALPRLDTLPFSSERQYMATSHLDPETGRCLTLLKGAVERVLDLCSTQMSSDGTLEVLDRRAVLDRAEVLAARGMRVLATARGAEPVLDALTSLEESADARLTFTGLQAMHDPPRSTARAAVRSCRRAGVEVKMITGDHPGTARAVARAVGLLDGHDGGLVLTGADLDRIDDADLPDAVETAVVFARVSPEQKLRLVEALQARHHVVAMTGDGVNDAPALKQADIGVAMGLGGTEVAKEAGDMVLTDDDFATIETAVQEGRESSTTSPSSSCGLCPRTWVRAR